MKKLAFTLLFALVGISSAFAQFEKGKYYLAVNNLDSAEVCYRLEMLKGRDYVNQNMAARGLSRIFQARNMADSALKYSVYSYDMNDSLYDRMATQEVEQVKGMYDYSRFQDYAIKEEEKANYFIKMTYSMIFGIIVIIIAASLYWYQLVKKRNLNLDKFLAVKIQLHQHVYHQDTMELNVAVMIQHISHG